MAAPSTCDYEAGSFVELEALEELMRNEFFQQALTFPQNQDTPQPCVYRYHALPGDDTIRILRLEAGIKNQPLRGTLVNLSLNNVNRKRYEALSYAWGPQETRYSIDLQTGILRITTSLYSALNRLRDPFSERFVWVDALCINQSDNVEKVTQILLMRSIYSLASCVLVYLGDDDGNGKFALELLERIAATSFSDLQQPKLSSEWIAAKNLPGLEDPMWLIIMAFWQRPWFRRAWVVQEFITAKKVTMICGEWEVDWRKLALAVEKLTEYNLVDWGVVPQGDAEVETAREEAFSGRMGLRVMMEMKNSTAYGTMIGNIVRSFAERDESGIQELEEGGWGKLFPQMTDLVAKMRKDPGSIEEISSIIESSLGSMFTLMGVEDTGIRLPLVKLLQIFEKTEATIPRDKLFALLGLAQDGSHEELRPNYEESNEEVLIRYARYFISTGDGIVTLAQAGAAARENQLLPSWVVDYTSNNLQKTHMLAMSSQTGLSYFAATSLPPNIRLTDNRNEILLAGSHLDTIKSIVRYPTIASIKTFTQHARDVNNFLNAAESMILSNPIPYPYPSSSAQVESRFDVLWRTLVANQSSRPMIAPEEWADQYPIARELVDNCEHTDQFFKIEEMTPWFERLMALMLCYQLAELEGGLVGLVPVETEIGDSVFIVSGGPIPFVVRQTGGNTFWKIVGACYIHGAMNNEAVGSENWHEVSLRIQ